MGSSVHPRDILPSFGDDRAARRAALMAFLDAHGRPPDPDGK
jgi:hypothetical protein